MRDALAVPVNGEPVGSGCGVGVEEGDLVDEEPEERPED